MQFTHGWAKLRGKANWWEISPLSSSSTSLAKSKLKAFNCSCAETFFSKCPYFHWSCVLWLSLTKRDFLFVFFVNRYKKLKTFAKFWLMLLHRMRFPLKLIERVWATSTRKPKPDRNSLEGFNEKFRPPCHVENRERKFIALSLITGFSFHPSSRDVNLIKSVIS